VNPAKKGEFNLASMLNSNQKGGKIQILKKTPQQKLILNKIQNSRIKPVMGERLLTKF